MADLYFYYASMNAGKTTQLVQAAYNYQERGMRALVMKPSVDDRDAQYSVISRVGLSMDAELIEDDTNLYQMIQLNIMEKGKIHCILIDESQFLSADHVAQLCEVVDVMGIPILCYGLRNDFQGKAFPGSAALLASADKLREIKGICSCGKKSTHVLRIDEDGKVVRVGPQVEIGGNDRYVAVCRKHWREGAYV